MSASLPSALPGLLEPWEGPRGKPVAASSPLAARQQRKQRGLELWEALHARNEAGVEEALENGADPNFVLNRLTPFWFAIQHQAQPIAILLLKHGANPRAQSQGKSVWVAIAPRDNLEEANWLKDILGGVDDAGAEDFLNYKAYRLFEWWLGLASNLQTAIPLAYPSSSHTAMNYRNHALAALRGPASILPTLTKLWRLNPKDVYSLTNTISVGMAYATWEEIARRDDVEMAQRALAHGWGPPRPEDLKSKELDATGKEPTPLYANMGWYFLDKSAYNLWKWWMGQEALAREFLAMGQTDPHNTVLLAAKDTMRLDRMLEAGIDFSVPDANGNLLLHHVVIGAYVTKAIGTWWLQKRPQDFSVPNHAGLMPLDQPAGKNSKPAVLASLKKVWLDYRLKNTPPEEASKRTRL